MGKRRCYVSRCYPHNLSGGFKAKMDIESIMEQNNFHNLGLEQKTNSNKIYAFFYNLLSILKAVISVKENDILVIQYPLKKYYYLLSAVAKFKNAKVIALIHDLGCFRRKRLTIDQEKKRLSHTDHLIVLSDKMKDFVVEKGYKQTFSVLYLWDYLNDTTPQPRSYPNLNEIHVLYVGSLKKEQKGFIYKWDDSKITTKLYLNIYGPYFDVKSIKNKDQFIYHGLKDSSLIIKETTAHYGLLWDSSEFKYISGAYGEYLKYNTSHKISLYIHAHLPLIVWSEASIAEFAKEHNIGICVDSLENLEELLQNVSEEEYLRMVDNTRKLSNKINQGYYFTTAYEKGEQLLLTNSK